MLGLVGFFAQLLLVIASAGFAFAVGNQPERHGALWVIANYVIGTAVSAAGWNSPTVNLILDGMYATGFLPLAVIYVSWWVGAAALLAAGSFSLEAAYLLQDLAVDSIYNLIYNALVLATAFTFIICGTLNLRDRRKQAAAERRRGLAAA